MSEMFLVFELNKGFQKKGWYVISTWTLHWSMKRQFSLGCLTFAAYFPVQEKNEHAQRFG